jgi:hypothetical protein
MLAAATANGSRRRFGRILFHLTEHSAGALQTITTQSMDFAQHPAQHVCTLSRRLSHALALLSLFAPLPSILHRLKSIVPAVPADGLAQSRMRHQRVRFDLVFPLPLYTILTLLVRRSCNYSLFDRQLHPALRSRLA